MTDPKKVIKRDVSVDVDLETGCFVMSPANIDLEDDETIQQFVARQKANGFTAWEFARECDLFENPTVYLQVIEHYDDGTKKCVDRGEWSDQ